MATLHAGGRKHVCYYYDGERTVYQRCVIICAECKINGVSSAWLERSHFM